MATQQVLQGRVWKYGDNVDTDAIIPARYLNMSTAAELARHCMEDATPEHGTDPNFAEGVKSGDIVVGGENFGCGSSREHAPLALKGAGVSCVIAESFARIFYRNAINIGLPIIVCPEAAKEARGGDDMMVDLAQGKITNLQLDKMYTTAPFPPFIMRIIEAGGLVPYTREQIRAGG